MHDKKKMYFALFIILFLIVFFPYLKVEILTSRHKFEFDSLYKLSRMIDEIEYLKVIDYSQESARVYYVGKEKYAGYLFKFIRDNNGWQLESWYAVWSTSGSADGFIWPYYR